MFGHALGAAVALEMLATVLAVTDDIAPPTMNYLGLDPECDLDYVPGQGRPAKLQTALSNSFGFGNCNVSLVFKTAQ